MPPNTKPAGDQDMNIMLTGATGFVGSHVLAHLVGPEDFLICMSTSATENATQRNI